MSNMEGMPAGLPPLAGSIATEAMEWFEAETPKPIAQVTAQEFERLCEVLADKRQLKKMMADDIKTCNEAIDKLEKQVLAYLHEWKRRDYLSKRGLIYIEAKRSWALPKGDDKKAFFTHLREEGSFDDMATIQSNTFNAYVGERFDKAEQEGRSAGFSLPGVGEPSVYEKLKMKGSKDE